MLKRESVSDHFYPNSSSKKKNNNRLTFSRFRFPFFFLCRKRLGVVMELGFLKAVYNILEVLLLGGGGLVNVMMNLSSGDMGYSALGR